MANTTKKTTTKKTTTRKKLVTKPKRKQMILDYNYAKSAAAIGSIIMAIVQGLAFYSIAVKITNGSYAASKLFTVLTVGAVTCIAIVIVLLFILLISQEDE